MAFQDVLRSFTFFSQKVWNCTTLPKLSSKVSKLLSPEEDQSDKFLSCTQYESSLKEQETNGTCPQTNCYAEPKTQGKERIDDSNRVVQEKSHCVGNEEISNSVGKNHKFSNLAYPKSKQRKIDSMYIAAVCVLLLMYLPPGQGAALGNTPAIYCESYLSNLSDSSGPWNQSMCSSELEKIHCQTGQIRRCVPFIPGDFFACCIKDPKGYTLKDDECILVTQIGGSNKKLAQCYGKEYCSPPAATSTPTYLKSTKNPLAPNATNEALSNSPNKSTETLNGFNWTAALTFLFCCWFIAQVCLAFVIFSLKYIQWISSGVRQTPNETDNRNQNYEMNGNRQGVSFQGLPEYM